VIVTIEDNGCGIAEEDLEKIFIPFYTTKHFGTGLGMAIVNRIVENHNGFLKIESTPNEGTKVKIYLRKKLWM
jgi:signal transduction histidine kinase